MFMPRKGSAPKKATAGKATAQEQGKGAKGKTSKDKAAKADKNKAGKGKNAKGGGPTQGKKGKGSIKSAKAGKDPKKGSAAATDGEYQEGAGPETPPTKEELGAETETGTVIVELLIDPNDAATADDRYTLKSGNGKYKKTLTPKDDKVPGDASITLEFQKVPGGTTYTLEVDPGKEGKPYVVFRDAAFKTIIE